MKKIIAVLRNYLKLLKILMLKQLFKSMKSELILKCSKVVVICNVDDSIVEHRNVIAEKSTVDVIQLLIWNTVGDLLEEESTSSISLTLSTTFQCWGFAPFQVFLYKISRHGRMIAVMRKYPKLLKFRKV